MWDFAHVEAEVAWTVVPVASEGSRRGRGGSGRCGVCWQAGAAAVEATAGSGVGAEKEVEAPSVEGTGCGAAAAEVEAPAESFCLHFDTWASRSAQNAVAYPGQ
eukprot:4622250-Pleurochrysis_carterae.AAC.1